MEVLRISNLSEETEGYLQANLLDRRILEIKWQLIDYDSPTRLKKCFDCLWEKTLKYQPEGFLIHSPPSMQYDQTLKHLGIMTFLYAREHYNKKLLGRKLQQIIVVPGHIFVSTNSRHHVGSPYSGVNTIFTSQSKLAYRYLGLTQ